MELDGVINAVVPYVTAAAGAYGGAVVRKVTDEASEATGDAVVGVGRRLLGRLLGARGSRPVVEAVVTELGEHPDDEDLQVAVRAQVRKLLTSEQGMAEEVAAILAEAGGAAAGTVVSVTGSQGVVVGDHARQTNTFHGAPPPSPS